MERSFSVDAANTLHHFQNVRQEFITQLFRAQNANAVWQFVPDLFVDFQRHDVVVEIPNQIVTVLRAEVFNRGLDLVAVHIALLDAGHAVVDRLELHIVHANGRNAAVVERDFLRPVDARVVLRVNMFFQQFRKPLRCFRSVHCLSVSPAFLAFLFATAHIWAAQCLMYMSMPQLRNENTPRRNIHIPRRTGGARNHF